MADLVQSPAHGERLLKPSIELSASMASVFPDIPTQGKMRPFSFEVSAYGAGMGALMGMYILGMQQSRAKQIWPAETIGGSAAVGFVLANGFVYYIGQI